jgi:hypothetical protein
MRTQTHDPTEQGARPRGGARGGVAAARSVAREQESIGLVEWITALGSRDTGRFLRAAAATTFGQSRHGDRAGWKPELRAALAYVDRVGRERDDARLWSGVDTAVNEQVDDAFEDGVLVGLSLARTWPTGPEEREDWPRRAVEEAGLGRPTDRPAPAGATEQQRRGDR